MLHLLHLQGVRVLHERAQSVSITDALAYLALAFLAAHLMADARHLVMAVRARHSQVWEVATFVALVGHLTLDYVS